MNVLWTVLVVIGLLGLTALGLSLRIVKQYERGVQFRLGRVIGTREPGLNFIVPLIDTLRQMSLRIITMPIQSQEIITRDNVSIDVSAVAYYRVTDAGRLTIPTSRPSWSRSAPTQAPPRAGPSALPAPARRDDAGLGRGTVRIGSRCGDEDSQQASSPPLQARRGRRGAASTGVWQWTLTPLGSNPTSTREGDRHAAQSR
jgi:SPFH domain / Band 7 family